MIERLIPDGLLPGNVYMHVAPINQGKTTLALQLAAATTIRESDCGMRKKVIHFNLEANETAAELFRSAGAMVSREAVLQLRTKSNGRVLTDEEAARLQEFMQIEKRYFKTYKLRERCSSRGRSILRLTREHAPVALIVIDTLSALVDMDGQDGGHRVCREAYTNAISTLQDIAGELACPVWITHQLASSENEKERGALPDFERILGRGDLWKCVHAGFASGRLNGKNCAVFQTFPNAANESNQLVGHLRADVACWSLADSDWQIWNGMASQRMERFAAQSYMTPGWDPRAAGFAV
ncbi:MAG: AAA family ATPase [Pirellulaceae bacterium]|nr:AAA family ATPase [Pirellulaceae bacterium]